MTWQSSSSVAVAVAGAVALAAGLVATPAPERAGAVREAGPTREAQAPRLLVVNKSSNTLSLVDPATREELAVASTGFSPHEVALSADGRRAYVTDYGTGARPGSTVSVVDLDAPRRTRTLSLEPHTRPHGISVAPDGSFWVTTEGSGHVLHVDPESGEILQAVERGQRTTHMVVVAPERGRVVATSIGRGTATVIDSETGRIVAQLETGAVAGGVDLHPDDRTAFVANTRDDRVTVVDLEEWAVAGDIVAGDEPDGMAWAPR